MLSPLPKQQILGSSNLKEFANDNFKFDENARKFFQWLENTVGKRRNCKQYLLFPQCFQNDLHCRRIKTGASLGEG